MPSRDKNSPAPSAAGPKEQNAYRAGGAARGLGTPDLLSQQPDPRGPDRAKAVQLIEALRRCGARGEAANSLRCGPPVPGTLLAPRTASYGETSSHRGSFFRDLCFVDSGIVVPDIVQTI